MRQQLYDLIYGELDKVPGFLNLSMDLQAELCVEVVANVTAEITNEIKTIPVKIAMERMKAHA